MSLAETRLKPLQRERHQSNSLFINFIGCTYWLPVDIPLAWVTRVWKKLAYIFVKLQNCSSQIVKFGMGDLRAIFLRIGDSSDSYPRFNDLMLAQINIKSLKQGKSQRFCLCIKIYASAWSWYFHWHCAIKGSENWSLIPMTTLLRDLQFCSYIMLAHTPWKKLTFYIGG